MAPVERSGAEERNESPESASAAGFGDFVSSGCVSAGLVVAPPNWLNPIRATGIATPLVADDDVSPARERGIL